MLSVHRHVVEHGALLVDVNRDCKRRSLFHLNELVARSDTLLLSVRVLCNREIDAAAIGLLLAIHELLGDWKLFERLHEKDIITKLDGEKISNYADLAKLLTYYKSGDTVTLTVQSLVNGSYQEREVQLTLKQRPAESDSENSQSQGGQQDQKPAQSQSKIGK